MLVILHKLINQILMHNSMFHQAHELMEIVLYQLSQDQKGLIIINWFQQNLSGTSAITLRLLFRSSSLGQSL